MASLMRLVVCGIARKWIGTPYVPRARVRGAGVDCAYLAVEVYADAGVTPRIDLGDYSPEAMLHVADERYVETVQQYGREVAAPQAGDLVVMRYGRSYSHGAIYVGDDRIVHAFVRRGVQEAELAEFAGRRMRFFTFFEGVQ